MTYPNLYISNKWKWEAFGVEGGEFHCEKLVLLMVSWWGSLERQKEAVVIWMQALPVPPLRLSIPSVNITGISYSVSEFACFVFLCLILRQGPMLLILASAKGYLCLLILLSPICWDHRHAPSHLFHVILGIKPRPFITHDKHMRKLIWRRKDLLWHLYVQRFRFMIGWLHWQGEGASWQGVCGGARVSLHGDWKQNERAKAGDKLYPSRASPQRLASSIGFP